MTDDPYLVSVDAEGRIILEPAVIMTASERRLLTSQAFRQRMTDAANAPAARFELDDL